MRGLRGFRAVMARVIWKTSVASHKISKPFFFTWHKHGLISVACGHVCCDGLGWALMSSNDVITMPIAKYFANNSCCRPFLLPRRPFDGDGISYPAVVLSRHSPISRHDENVLSTFGADNLYEMFLLMSVKEKNLNNFLHHFLSSPIFTFNWCVNFVFWHLANSLLLFSVMLHSRLLCNFISRKKEMRMVKIDFFPFFSFSSWPFFDVEGFFCDKSFSLFMFEGRKNCFMGFLLIIFADCCWNKEKVEGIIKIKRKFLLRIMRCGF